MWRVLGASEAGVSHAASATPCQDAHRYAFASSEELVCAVADGLGSAPRSEVGSTLAVETAVEYACEELQKGDSDWLAVARDAFAGARSVLAGVASREGVAIEQFDTTLLLIIAGRDRVVSGHVGDGAIILLHEDHSLETISPPERNEYANIVTPITVDELDRVIRLREVRGPIEGIAMMTDGLQTLAINNETDAAFPAFFAPLFRGLAALAEEPTEQDREDLREFLRSERVCRTTSDDKTLLWAVPAPRDRATVGSG